MEVPTVVSFSSLQQSTAEQIIDIPVPRLRGVHPGRGSLLRSVEQNVGIPVPHGRGRVGGRGLQGLRPEQSSTAVAEQNVSTPVPRRGGSRGGLQGFFPGQNSTQRIVEQNVDLPVPRPRPSRGFPPGLGSQRTVERIIDIPVSRTRDGGGLPGVHLQQGSTARGGAHYALLRRVEELLAISADSGLVGLTGPRQSSSSGLVHGMLVSLVCSSSCVRPGCLHHGQYGPEGQLLFPPK